MTRNRARVIAERISPLRRGSSRTLMTAFLTLLPIRTAAIKASIHTRRRLSLVHARPSTQGVFKCLPHDGAGL